MSQPHSNNSDECKWFPSDPDRTTPDAGCDANSGEREWLPNDPDCMTPDIGDSPPPSSPLPKRRRIQAVEGREEDNIDETVQLHNVDSLRPAAIVQLPGAYKPNQAQAQLNQLLPQVLPQVNQVNQTLPPGQLNQLLLYLNQLLQQVNQAKQTLPPGQVNQLYLDLTQLIARVNQSLPQTLPLLQPPPPPPPGQQGNVNNNNRLTFAIDGRVIYHSKKFSVDGVDFKVKILTPPRNTPYREVMDTTAKLLERIFNARMRLGDVKQNDRIRFVIISPKLTTNISTTYQKLSKVSVEWFADFVCSKLQSHESLDLNDGFNVHIQTIKLDQGHTAIRVTRGLALDKRIEKSRAIFSNLNKGVADLPCFILSLYLLLNCKPGNHCNQSEFRMLLKQTPKVRQGVFEIMDQMGLTRDYKTTDVTEFHAFQKYVTENCNPDINLNVIKSNSFGDLLYRGAPDTAKNNIVIMLHEERFLPVLKLSLWLEKEAYCFTCQKTVDLKLHKLTPEGTCHRGESERSKANCSKCLQKSCFEKKPLTKFCDQCFGHFRNAVCFDNHKQFGLCDPKNICGKCFKWKPSTANHICNPVVKCSACRKIAGVDHVCFVQVNEKKTNDKFRYIFYDFAFY